VQDILQTGCPSCHPTNSVIALKEDYIFHAAAMSLKFSFLDVAHMLNMPSIPVFSIVIIAYSFVVLGILLSDGIDLMCW